MSGIPVYTSSPITATKASGTTTQTAASPQNFPLATSTTSASTPRSTSTGASASSSIYPQAKPGAAAISDPTAAAQSYAPAQPTPTTRTGDMQPPAPQPGAVPTPLNRSVVPPPPKAGETYQPPPTAAPMPPQMGYAPPTMTYGSQPLKSSTSTTNTPSVPYPVGIPSAADDPRRSLEHPPGYHQDVYASELTSDQRRAHEAELANSSSVFGSLDNGSAGGFEADGVWNTAKKWAQQAGEKISATEQEVWKKINKN
ncbi:uncharacterized protein L3040_007149 [Drepanopeziza brunnea f. sp. 'multigermtubi']|nr:hypothetical protein L3040_007149 [Drepanopeziza brunnea f. sp. 'multigermtubi']